MARVVAGPILIAVSVLLLLSAASASEKPRRSQHEAQPKPTQQAIQEQQPQVPLSVWQRTDAALSESIRAHKEQSIAERKQAEASQQTFCSPSVLVNEVLALIGIGYLIFMGLQWSAIREQATTARTALMRLERPWIVVGLKDAKIYAVGRDDFSLPYMAQIFLSKQNSGRSLGWIVGGTVKAVIVTPARPLPEVPDYGGGSGISFGQEPLPQSQELDSPEQRIFVDGHETWNAFHSGNIGQTYLAVYGRLEYRGVLEPDGSRLHETCFCLYLMPPIAAQPEKGKPVTVGAYYAGPAAYNRLT